MQPLPPPARTMGTTSRFTGSAVARAHLLVFFSLSLALRSLFLISSKFVFWTFENVVIPRQASGGGWGIVSIAFGNSWKFNFDLNVLSVVLPPAYVIIFHQRSQRISVVVLVGCHLRLGKEQLCVRQQRVGAYLCKFFSLRSPRCCRSLCSCCCCCRLV